MRLDAFEAIANAVLGLVISWLMTWAVLGFSSVASAGITGMFFCLSMARSFFLRRVFRRLALLDAGRV